MPSRSNLSKFKRDVGSTADFFTFPLFDEFAFFSADSADFSDSADSAEFADFFFLSKVFSVLFKQIYFFI